ncbi:MAG: T9SS type A sorting domain-containing protein, partial [Bacteroidales bacterium]|nr:T9SS type A sorting domain-containing protein [Bacteroidales bacterium]
VDSMFYNSGLSVDNYDNLLIGWAEQSLESGLIFNAENSQYCQGGAARDSLISKFNWIITDGGLEADAPVPDIATLSDVIAECEVSSLTSPTANDCVGIITGTHDATLPIIEKDTTIVTWTYDDGHGNTSTQLQYVIIKDVTAPVPGMTNLPNVIAECEVTKLVVPKATDNCSDTVYVSHDASLPITDQGTTFVTWTFDDGNGNTSTQLQNVIIEDKTAPAIACVEDKEIVIEGDTYTIQGTGFDPVNINDNCAIASVSNDLNNEESLAGAELPVGTNTITWTITDNAGNSSSCTFDVVVSKSTSLQLHQTGAIEIYPNPAKDYVIINGINDNTVLISFYSAKGNMVYSENVYGNHKVDVSAYESGLYFLQIKHANHVETLKLIIE